MDFGDYCIKSFCKETKKLTNFCRLCWELKYRCNKLYIRYSISLLLNKCSEIIKMGADRPLELTVVRDHTPGRVRTREVEDADGNKYARKSYDPNGPEPYKQAIAAFRREMEVLQGIDQHRCIPRIEEVGEGHYVRQWMSGKSLRDWMTEDPVHTFSQEEVLYIASEVLDALEHARTYGITHRDIKPENISYDRDADDKPVGLLDFSAARIHSTTTTFSQLGDASTFAYLAPEEYLGHVDHQTDLYHLGSTLTEILTGKPLSEYIHGRNIERFRIELPDSIDSDMQTVLYGLLAVNPKHRYETAGQAREDFERVIAGEKPVGVLRNISPVKIEGVELTRTEYQNVNGVLLEIGDQEYEQIDLGDAYLRVFTTEEGYRGVLHIPGLKNNKEDAEIFRNLTDRVSELTGDAVSNSREHYAEYVSNDGLEVKLAKGGGALRVNRKDEIEIDFLNPEGIEYKKKKKSFEVAAIGKNTEELLHKKSRPFGAASSALAYIGAASATFSFSLAPDGNAGGAFVATLFASYMYLMLDMLSGLVNYEGGLANKLNIAGRFYFTSYLTGYLPAKTLPKRRLLKSDYLLNEIGKTHKKLEDLRANDGSKRRVERLTRKAEELESVLLEVFPQTEHRKGLTLTYEGSREEVMHFFDSLLAPEE